MNAKCVYIVCPDIVTGGPESLHFLCHQLYLRNIKAAMYYCEGSGDKCKKAFSIYQTSSVSEIADDSDAIVIIPETFMETAVFYKKASVYIYWLSVDYAFISRKFKHPLFRIIDYLIRPKNYFGNSPGLFEKSRRRLSLLMRDTSPFHKLHNHAKGHLCNSQYALDFCEKFGYDNACYLGVPVRKLFNQNTYQSVSRKNIVLYNPLKSGRMVRFLALCYPDISFFPLQNMPAKEIWGKMRVCKIFLDMGKHPGRERMPREAALCGCIIITNRRGSAEGNDVPIPDRFKVNSNLFKLKKLIREGFCNYKDTQNEFGAYQKHLQNDFNKFDADLNAFLNAESNDNEIQPE